MKWLIQKYGIIRVKHHYRHFQAILLGAPITTKKAADEHVFDDEIYWAYLEQIQIDFRVGFEFDEFFHLNSTLIFIIYASSTIFCG